MPVLAAQVAEAAGHVFLVEQVAGIERQLYTLERRIQLAQLVADHGIDQYIAVDLEAVLRIAVGAAHVASARAQP
ncbi:hypothetical protein D3C79_991950 [compost metagenome]